METAPRFAADKDVEAAIADIRRLLTELGDSGEASAATIARVAPRLLVYVAPAEMSVGEGTTSFRFSETARLLLADRNEDQLFYHFFALLAQAALVLRRIQK